MLSSPFISLPPELHIHVITPFLEDTDAAVLLSSSRYLNRLYRSDQVWTSYVDRMLQSKQSPTINKEPEEDAYSFFCRVFLCYTSSSPRLRIEDMTHRRWMLKFRMGTRVEPEREIQFTPSAFMRTSWLPDLEYRIDGSYLYISDFPRHTTYQTLNGGLICENNNVSMFTYDNTLVVAANHILHEARAIMRDCGTNPLSSKKIETRCLSVFRYLNIQQSHQEALLPCCFSTRFKELQPLTLRQYMLQMYLHGGGSFHLLTADERELVYSSLSLYHEVLLLQKKSIEAMSLMEEIRIMKEIFLIFQ